MSRFINERRDERFKSDLVIRMEQGEGVVRDLSASGIYFITDVPLKAGETFNFTMEFQDWPSGPIVANCIARIVRLEKQGTRNGVAAWIDSIEFRRIPKAADD